MSLSDIHKLTSLQKDCRAKLDDYFKLHKNYQFGSYAANISFWVDRKNVSSLFYIPIKTL